MCILHAASCCLVLSLIVLRRFPYRWKNKHSSLSTANITTINRIAIITTINIIAIITTINIIVITTINRSVCLAIQWRKLPSSP